MLALAMVLTGACGGGTGSRPQKPSLRAITPRVVDPMGGSRVVVMGSGFARATSLTIGGVPATEVVSVSDTELRARSAAVASATGLDVTVAVDGEHATLAGAVDAWSPAEIGGARVFDAAAGTTGAHPATSYEWARITAEISPGWRRRDGPTLTWLPSTNKFWMVGGWNGYQSPDGFSPVDPTGPTPVYPEQNTTNEVWSSPDGATWALELPHGHDQFVRRHIHNTSLWHDRLWIVGGDSWTGVYNHDVLSSADGVHWTVANANPPWPPRAAGVSGVYAGKLWMVGGQDMLGLESGWVDHNDVWNSEDGVTWTQVLPDEPASRTHWSPRGVVGGLVEFQGRMWLVGGAVYSWVNSLKYPEVWSTTDGVSWTRHATPPWAGKIFADVLVFDNKLWSMFGYASECGTDPCVPGNTNDIYYSEDGERWTRLPMDSPVPLSHAQGVAVGPDSVLLAGGNYTFDRQHEKEVWRMKAWKGTALEAWTARSANPLVLSASAPEERPLWVENGLGPGAPGVLFDGSTTSLELAHPDESTGGQSVFFVARVPWHPSATGFNDLYSPSGSVVGGNAGSLGATFPLNSVGLQNGQLVYTNREDQDGSLVFRTTAVGEGLQNNVGEVRLLGFTHGTSGALQGYVDGARVGEPVSTNYGTERGWSRVGRSVEGLNDRFHGMLGAVVVIPSALDAATVERIHQWSIGRFGAR